MYSLFVGVKKGLREKVGVEDEKVSTLTGLNPMKNINFLLVTLTTRPQCLISLRYVSIMGIKAITLGLLDPISNQLSYTDSI